MEIIAAVAIATKQLTLTPCLCNLQECITDRSTSYVLQTVLYKTTEFLNDEEENPFVRLLHQVSHSGDVICFV